MAHTLRSLRLAPQLTRSVFGHRHVALQARPFSARTTVLEKKYTSSHEWVELHGNTATIGITNYAAEALGDVVYVELPEKDLELEQGEAMGAVESVKSASDIYIPVSGTIVETNSALEEKPGIINKGAETDGWLAKIEISKPEEMEELLSKSEYDALDKNEGH